MGVLHYVRSRGLRWNCCILLRLDVRLFLLYFSCVGIFDLIIPRVNLWDDVSPINTRYSSSTPLTVSCGTKGGGSIVL